MLKNKKLVAFLIFLSCFSFLLILKPALMSISRSYLIATNKVLLENWVNEEYATEKYASIVSDKEAFLKVSCKFFNSNGSGIERYMLFDVFTEFVLPMMLVFGFTLTIWYYFKLKYHFVINAFLLGGFVFTLKIIAMIFDNYNYQNYSLSEFSFPFSQMIYYFNKLLNITGSSLNFVIPLLLMLVMLAIYHKQIGK